MLNLSKSLYIHQIHKEILRTNLEPIPELINFILEQAKFFIAIDGRYLLKDSKKDFQLSAQKFIMVEIKTIELIKTHGFNIHFMLNKGTVDEVGITLSTVDFKLSGLYIDMKSAADDIRVIMDEYEKRQKTYQHNLNQTNKSIEKLLIASAGILDSYPEVFV